DYSCCSYRSGNIYIF
nr:immunoglobulin light chain junction region [Macaca mulatta]